ncbi:HEXXH motif domain-containing protein [Actinomycetes bacterium KLBMP 9797]
MRRYRLTDSQFADLAAGYGGPDAMATLVAGQRSKRKLLLRVVFDEAARLGVQSRLSTARALLTRVRTQRPELVEESFGYPFLDSWATRCVEDPRVAESYLSGFAASVASRAELPFSIAIPAADGVVYLPMLGTAAGLGDGPVTVSGDGRSLVLAGSVRTITLAEPRQRQDGWEPVAVISAGAPERRLTVVIDDQDPHRNCFQWRVAPMLSSERREHLARLLAHAWQLIVARHPEHACGMSVALRSVVPLVPPSPGGSVSAASRVAGGAVAVAPPADAEELALLLVHEFAHMKLGGLLDLVDLHESQGRGLYRAPWRADPRPVGALLQGAYAHLAVTDYWRARRISSSTADREVDFEFAYWREQTKAAVATLEGSGELTDAGRVFVAGLGETVDRWHQDGVRGDIAEAVDDIAVLAAVRWRLANRAPVPDEVKRLARQWREGAPCGALPEDRDAALAAAPGPAGMPGLAGWLRSEAIGSPEGRANDVDEADAAYLKGDLVAAAEHYARRVASDLGDDLAWAGLARACRHLGWHAAASALEERPALVRALVEALRTPAVEGLAAWLGKEIGHEQGTFEV